jgi:hypothetical protein
LRSPLCECEVVENDYNDEENDTYNGKKPNMVIKSDNIIIEDDDENDNDACNDSVDEY